MKIFEVDNNNTYNNQDVDSVISSNSFILNINSQQSLTNPYDQSKNVVGNLNTKNEISDLVVLDYQTGSKLWILVSILLTSLFYGVVVFLNVDFISTKVYHSFSIGLLILIDKLFFIKNYGGQEDAIDEVFKSQRDEYLLNKNQPSQHRIETTQEEEAEWFKEVRIYIIAAGLLIFICELSIFYILKRTAIFQLNASIGIMILGIEYILIKLKLLYDKLELS